jgi:hypothetical protein
VRRRERRFVGGVEDVHAQLVIVDDHRLPVGHPEFGEGVDRSAHLFRRRRSFGR